MSDFVAAGRIYAPAGMAGVAAWLSAGNTSKNPVLVVCADYPSLQQLAAEIDAILTRNESGTKAETAIHIFPGWDVPPYDRGAPRKHLQALRMSTLAALKQNKTDIYLATVSGMATKVPPLESIPQPMQLKAGEAYHRQKLIDTLVSLGYSRVQTVLEPGEFALRGALLDIFPATADVPIRAEFFDDELETLHTFDATSQRRDVQLKTATISPAAALVLDAVKAAHFRGQYRDTFAGGQNDMLYQQVSDHILPPVASHYLPLFFQTRLPSLAELWGDRGAVYLAPNALQALQNHDERVTEAYDMRVVEATGHAGSDDTYRPLPPEKLYVLNDAWQPLLARATELSVFENEGDKHSEIQPLDLPKPPLAGEGLQRLITLLKDNPKRKIILTAGREGQLDRLAKLLETEADIAPVQIKQWHDAQVGKVSLLLAPFAHGWQDKNQIVVTAMEVFGARVVRRSSKQAADALMHYSELAVGDFVVHRMHGISRYEGLEQIVTAGVAQDFVKLTYDDGTLYVPVVNLDVLSRYGASETTEVALDRLGSAAWQARRARVKRDLLEMAHELVKIAAERKLAKGHAYQLPPGLYESFCAAFEHQPTPEQAAAMSDVEQDLLSDKPMDRLIVGDVGFGKTEVAIRAAFIVAASGRQVAILCPTTLLTRQHYEVIHSRLSPFGLNVAALSRLQSAAEAKRVKAGLKAGNIDVVVGTHALLGNSVEFKDLALVVIDEEQRFGVKHKEKLKSIKANVDVLTLTATPIPRTLQQGVSGLRELSLITTPPVERLPVRSYVTPFESKTLREAILREIRRNGEVYIVTPRIEDIPELTERIEGLVPEAKIRTAHGQMTPDELEDVMNAFYDGQFNVLISTTIVESGLDVPSANTMIINRADRFGLSQLHQLRGRVGRRGTQAYCYFLQPERGQLGDVATKRLQLLQRLEGLGGGFKLANFDMDLRGAGNILGKQQSGHIREVGYALYAELLKEAVQEIQAKQEGKVSRADGRTPTINLAVSYQLPAFYVQDLDERLQLYRRLAQLEDEAALAEFRAELLDRFGALPDEAELLLQVIAIKLQAMDLNIEKLDIGPNAVTLKFWQNKFAAPEALFGWIGSKPGTVTVRPDQTLVIHKRWQTPQSQLVGVVNILSELKALVDKF